MRVQTQARTASGLAAAALRVLCALSVLATAAVSPAVAGTIGFKTDAKVTAGPGVRAEVTLTHTGDEAAGDIRVDAELLGKKVEGEVVPTILPGQNHVWNFDLAQQVPKGSYSIVLRARYEDSNGYEFEIVSTAAAPVGVTPLPKLSGSVEVANLPVGGSTDAVLNVRKSGERRGPFEVQLIAPSGLDVTPERLTLDFGTSDKATAQFRIRNKNLLAGTSVNLFAFVTAEDGGFPQTDAIRGVARVTQPVLKVTAAMFYKTAGAIALVGLLLELARVFGLFGRRTSDA